MTRSVQKRPPLTPVRAAWRRQRDTLPYTLECSPDLTEGRIRVLRCDLTDVDGRSGGVPSFTLVEARLGYHLRIHTAYGPGLVLSVVCKRE